jgi:hypothetical protein
MTHNALLEPQAATDLGPMPLSDAAGALAGLMETAQKAVFSGPGRLRCVSLNLELGQAIKPDEPVVCQAWIDRQTRSLLFAQSQLLRGSDRVILATASGIWQIEIG